MAHKLATKEVQTRIGASKAWEFQCSMVTQSATSFCFAAKREGIEVDIEMSDEGGNVSVSVFAYDDDEQEPIASAARVVHTENQLGCLISEAVKAAVKSPMLKHRLAEI